MIRVLVVEDDPLTAELHGEYVRRLEGFELAGTAPDARAAHRVLLAAGAAVDLVLLDLTLPGPGGLELARAVRSAGVTVDVIAVTAVRDLTAIETAMSLGAVQYLIKPFGFAAFQEKLQAYAAYRARIRSAPAAASQEEVDRLLAARRPAAAPSLPKGLTTVTLDTVAAALRAETVPLSATEVGLRCDLSRVTARRYLEHLADLGLAVREQRYGGPGRPEVVYKAAAASRDAR